MPVELEALTPRRIALVGHPQDVALHVVRGGVPPPQGEALVFIHGAMGDWRAAAPQWAAFTPHFDCVAYSRRFSFPNDNVMESPAHSALDEADDLLRLMDVLAIARAHFVGSSYGGFTALALAVRAPDRVASVVAVEPPMMKYAYRTPAGATAAEAFRQATIEPANAAFRAGDDALGAALMTGGISGATVDANSPAMQRRMQNVLAMKRLALSSDEFPMLEPAALAALSMPVLLLSGRNTAPVHAAIFKNVATEMPNATAEIIEGAGHGVARDQAALFNARVLRFLGRAG